MSLDFLSSVLVSALMISAKILLSHVFCRGVNICELVGCPQHGHAAFPPRFAMARRTERILLACRCGAE